MVTPVPDADRALVRTTILLTAALREALDLLIELRDCPLSDLERRQAQIDAVVAEAERLLSPSE
jgi:hypothetical protein